MFEITTRYTFSDFLMLNRLSAKTYRKWRTVLFRLFTGLLGTAFTFIGILMLADEGFSATWLFVLIVGIWMLVIAVFIHWVQAYRTGQMKLDGINEIEYHFDEDAISVVTAKQTAKTLYSSLHSIFRYRERYFLCVDRQHAFIVPFSCFADGERECFEQFLCEKSGRAWNVLNTGRKKERKLKEVRKS